MNRADTILFTLCTCEHCGGEGHIKRPTTVYAAGCHIPIPDHTEETCQQCQGAGYVIEETDVEVLYRVVDPRDVK